ncbi:MAG TPA: endonuclease/exonuclease/phosphatase family protein [Gammaproteobacteria bacterium]|nr:endonuclease/exonuclease/phosphatase family protein [Gammaproteobacteria bacterium]
MTDFDIRVLTYNIHKGFSAGNLRFVLEQIREELRRANVDIVFLQEIQGQHLTREKKVVNWPTESQFEYIADRVWSHFAYAKNAIYNSGHHGNAILSKYPFIEWENLRFSTIRPASRSLLHGVVNIPEKGLTLHVICVHLDFLPNLRKQQIKRLNDRIHESVPDNEPMILAGDFNDWHGQVSKHLASDLGLSEVFFELHGKFARTFPSWRPFFPVDRIYYRGLEPIECTRHHEPPWHKLSDHTPLYAKFGI